MVISLNSNLFSSKNNVNSLCDTTTGDVQLKFTSSSLAEAKQNNQQVILVSHHPVGFQNATIPSN